MGKKNKKLKLAVILSSCYTEYVNETMKGIRSEAMKEGIDVYVFNANTSPDELLKHNLGEYNIFNLINFNDYDGVILFANLIQARYVYDSIVERIIESKVPTVSIDAEIEGMYSVSVENYAPMKEIVSHFIEKHHCTKINFIAGQDFNTDNQERLQAYKDALTEHGIPVDEGRIYVGSFTNIHGKTAAIRMVELGDELPQAVVCANDDIAIGASGAFEKYGIKMPDEIAYSGFDDVFEARNSVPSLTSVSRNLALVGEEAVKKIVKVLEGKPVEISKRFPATPIYRRSCGCEPEEKEDMASFRTKYLEAAQKYKRHLSYSNMLMYDLTGCRNYEELISRLDVHVKKMFDDGGFYLFLNKDLKDALEGKITMETSEDQQYLINGYPKERTLAVCFHDGNFHESGMTFSGRLLPEQFDDDASGHLYFFSPVHFRDRCLGYVMLDNCKFPFESQIYNIWLMNLCNCIEGLRKQMHSKSMIDRLDKMYVLDALTGIYNRFGFERYTELGFQVCKDKGRQFMLLFADMDGLKGINDKYGHEEGDIAIKTVANALKDALSGREICARYGGDEFIVFAEGYDDEAAKLFVERFERQLEAVNNDPDKKYTLGVSCGYVIAAPDTGDKIEQYMEMADNCMYIQKMKKKGINL